MRKEKEAGALKALIRASAFVSGAAILAMMLVTQWITRKLTYQAPDAVEQQKSIPMRIMNLAMPLFSAYIAFIWPAAIGIYWFIRNVYQVIQQFLIAKLMPLPQFTEEDYKAAEREMRGKAQQKKVEKSPDAGSKKSLFHMDDDDYVPPEDDSPKSGHAEADAKNAAIEAAPLKDAPKKKGGETAEDAAPEAEKADDAKEDAQPAKAKLNGEETDGDK